MAQRIQCVDAIRGIAAMAVVLYHYGERIGWENWGNLGVPMFFVLSGFVIARSVGDRPPVSAGYLGRFALRRAIRLDPPYWLSMAAIIVIGVVAARFGIQSKDITAGQVAAHLLYLQGFLGYEQILVVYWTLCYEIQFYLALILLLWVGNAARAAMPLIFVTLVLSLFDRQLEVTGSAFMGRFWFCFVAGAMVHWITQEKLRIGYFVASLALISAAAMNRDLYALTTLITALALYAALSLGRGDIGSSRVLQFLGRISYSLYLTHLIGGWVVMTIATKFVPAWAAMALGVVVAVVSAWIFYLVVEAPATKLSKLVPADPVVKAQREPAV